MQFLHPLLLWGLLFMAIPIIVHLFYFRRYKKVLFNNVKLLRDIQEEKSLRRQLRNILILSTRLGAIVFAVWAFAQPFFFKGGEQSLDPFRVSIYIDNSPSMQIISTQSDLLNLALDRAEEIINSYDDKARFQIITNDINVANRNFVHPMDALARLNEIEITSKIRSIDNVVKTQRYLFSKESSENKSAYLLSDFQTRNVDGDIGDTDNIDYYLCPIRSNSNANLSIDSVWIDAPKAILNESQNLYIKLRNYGPEDRQTSLQLTVNNRESSLGTVTVPKGEEVIDTANLSINEDEWFRCAVSLSDEGIHFDDEYFFSFRPMGKIKLMELSTGAPNPYIHASLGNTTFFETENSDLSQVPYDRFPEQDLLVVENFRDLSSGFVSELSKFVKNGGSACLFLGKDVSPQTLQLISQNLSLPQLTEVSTTQKAFVIHYENPIVKNVFDENRKDLDLPEVTDYYKPASASAFLPIIELRNGDPLLAEASYGDGHLFIYFSSPVPGMSNMANYPEFISPLLYKMGVLNSNANPLSATIGKPAQYIIKQEGSTESSVYVDVNGSKFIPYQTKKAGETIVQTKDLDVASGIYPVGLDDDNLGFVALNISRKESDIASLTADELKSVFPQAVMLTESEQKDLGKTIKEFDTGSPIWKYLLIFVAIFLLTETILLRFWK